VRRADDGRAVTDAAQVAPMDALDVRLARGWLAADVTATGDGAPPGGE
jgi:exonuclease VII large subunit